MPGLANNENAGEINGPRFFFVHLMKTGGTSFAFQLRKEFKPREVYPSVGFDLRDETDVAGYVSISRLLRLSPERRADIRVYTGHFPFVASELLDLDLVNLTLLRDPVDRTISLLKHFKRVSKLYRSKPLEEIYDDPFVFAHFIENHQTRLFSVTAEDKPEVFGSTMSYWTTASLLGLGNASLDTEAQDGIDRERAIAAAEPSTVDARRFEVAKAQLAKIDVIGFSEQYDEFIDELRRRFGWWPSGIDTKGKVNISREAWEASAVLRQRIAADNAFDVQLYEYAKQLVNRRRPSAIATTSSPPERTGPRRSHPAPHGAHAAPPGRAMPARPARRDRLRAEIRAKHPRFFEALVADARITARYRSERAEFRGRADALIQALRLMSVSDAFLAQALYRAKARLQTLGVPVLPRIAHRLAMMTGQISIGDPVVVRPGVYIAHGQVVIDGFVEIHRGVVIFPWVTIGLRAGDVRGPTIGRDVHIGTGAKVIGPVTVHRSARIGANAVVVTDIAARTTVVGAPARPVRDVATP
jgi:serine acetyltransferase